MISFCPAGICGPCDLGITPSMNTILDLLHGLPTIDTGWAYVDVRDVGFAHARAVQGGEPGQRFILSAENMMLVDLAKTISELTGVKTTHVGLGRPAIKLAARFYELVARIKKSEPTLSYARADETAGRYQFTTGEKAALTFDLEYRSIRQAIIDSISWLLYLGAVEQSLAEQLSDKFPPDPEWGSAMPGS